jgi:hypothetical protein
LELSFFLFCNNFPRPLLYIHANIKHACLHVVDYSSAVVYLLNKDNRSAMLSTQESSKWISLHSHFCGGICTLIVEPKSIQTLNHMHNRHISYLSAMGVKWTSNRSNVSSCERYSAECQYGFLTHVVHISTHQCGVVEFVEIYFWRLEIHILQKHSC